MNAKECHTCTSLPPSLQEKSTCMEVVMDKMHECTIKIGAHTPCTECIHNLCLYPVCSGYIHAPRELMLWTHGERGGESVTYMIGQRSSYCRSWFELYQPILIQLKCAVNNMAQLCSLEKPLLMYFLHLQNSEMCRDLVHCNYLSW